MEFGILSLGDLNVDVTTGRRPRAVDRSREVIGYATLADELGLDVFAVGEHHSRDFITSSPAVVLAAAAAATRAIRLTSAVTLLGVADPVRVYQDFATLDLISNGRAEITVGRSAFVEPFELFGYDTADYDALFVEKLDLLLQLRESDDISWAGRFRQPLRHAEVVPRALQLPVWVGVGGSPNSAIRAGRLGLPMTLGFIGGTADNLRPLADAYREAGGTRLAVSTHFYAGRDPGAVYPSYREYLRPKRPGGRGFDVSPAHFDAGRSRHGALMIGSPEQVTEKLGDLRDALDLDRVYGQVDWGGLPAGQVRDSIACLAQHIAPALR